MKTFLVMNGPNLNLLGKREPEIYGSLTLDAINARIQKEADALGVKVEFFQSNHEGAMIDRLHEAMGKCDGVVINAGGHTHTSVSMCDAIGSTGLRVIEVHLSNVHKREEFRHHSYISAVAEGTISGLGWRSYVLALRALAMSTDVNA